VIEIEVYRYRCRLVVKVREEDLLKHYTHRKEKNKQYPIFGTLTGVLG
jgi:hypothetical protein